MKGWEQVVNRKGETVEGLFRLEVSGGWLYVSTYTYGQTMQYVPDLNSQLRGLSDVTRPI